MGSSKILRLAFCTGLQGPVMTTINPLHLKRVAMTGQAHLGLAVIPSMQKRPKEFQVFF